MSNLLKQKGSLNVAIRVCRPDQSVLTTSINVGEYHHRIDEKAEVLEAIRILSNYIGYDVQILPKS